MRPRIGILSWSLALALGLPSGAIARSDDVPMAPTAADLAVFEKARDKRPGNAERRDELALAYYRFARAAFDRRAFSEYEKYLALAVDEWIESLRIEPANPEPHTFMSMVAMYQGRLDDALESAHNARALAPGVGVTYANVAAVLVKAGAPARQVEEWLRRAERVGVSPAPIEWHYCFLRWREGKEDVAARHFYRAVRFDKQMVRVWNGALVDEKIATFEDLRRYCCGSPACGPYYEKICAAEGRPVARREVPEETALRELRIEMQRRRELERIYRERRDLDVRVKDAEDAPSPAPEGKREAAPE